MTRGPAVLLFLCSCHRAFGLHEVMLDALDEDTAPVVDAPRPDGQPPNCPSGYTIVLQSTASLYRLETSKASWDSARKDCADDATVGQSLTHLVVWSNMAERDEMRARELLPGDTWIGASSLKVATYAWVTDENTANYVLPVIAPTLEMPSPEPWEPDQPDSGSGRCAESRQSGFLHDETCTDSSAYICECDGRAEVPANF